MGATVENGAETPVEEQDYAAELEAARAAQEASGEFPDPPAQTGEKVPQTHTLQITGLVVDGAPADLKRGEFIYFEGVCKVQSASIADKLDKETFVTLEAVKAVKAACTDLRIERGHPGKELDPLQQSLGV